MPKVYNKRDTNIPKDAIYVGRPTKYGNPFKIGRDGTREEVIQKYEKLLKTHWITILEDAERELIGKDLVCWCAPLPCHADILLRLVNK